MKKRHILLIAAVVLAGLICVLCIGRIENRTDDQWSHIHLLLNDELTVQFPVKDGGQPCVFQWETGRGSFSAEITDADGEVVFSTTSEKNGSSAFLAESDLTLRIDAKGHGGIFALTRRDDPAVLSTNAADKYLLLGDGNHSGGTFTRTFECQKVDGKNVNFYVENYGSGPVTITINGSYTRTIDAGSAGHIRAPIATSILAQPMALKCVSEDGEDLNIYWKAAQRDTTG